MDQPTRFAELTILFLILALAAGLRIYKLGISPPGLNVDEANDAWNAFCMLKTGMDAHGARWPIVYIHGFGQGETTLFLYLSLPFEAIGGLSVIAVRSLAVAFGVFAVWLIYLLGKRLFDSWIGLAAAGLLAVNPWHLQQSRWGHEGTLTPVLVCLPLLALLWANFPLGRPSQEPLLPARAAIAGIVTGLDVYAYPAALLFLPVFLLGCIIFRGPTWWNVLKNKRGWFAVAAFISGIATVAWPYVWGHLTRPELNARLNNIWVWNPTDSPFEKLLKVLSRYPGHFGLDFLFMHGDHDVAYSSPDGYGLFLWYMLPLMILGAIFILSQWKTSPSASFLLVWLLVYPVADLPSEHVSPHALRSLPGLCGLVLLASVGLVGAARWLWRRHRRTAVLSAIVAAIVILISNVQFLDYFFGDFNSEPAKNYVGHVDLLEACRWLKSRLKDEDAVFVTGTGMSHPYIYTLVGLQYDPRQWFRDPKTFVKGPLPNGAYRNEELCLRYGKLHFVFGDSSQRDLEELTHSGYNHRVVFIVRPGEVSFGRQVSPVYQIQDPQGNTTLVIYEIAM